MIMMMIGLFSQRAWTTASSYEQNPSLGFKSSMFGILIFSSHDSRPPAAECHLLKIKRASTQTLAVAMLMPAKSGGVS